MNTEILQKLKENISSVMIGNETTIELVLTALVAKGHILLEDVPGTGKTVMAKLDEQEMNQLILYLNNIYSIAEKELEARKIKDRKEREHE